MSASPVLLLHVSEPAFGPRGRFAGADASALGRILAAAVELERAALGVETPVSLVVCTGDVAQSARPAEFAEAAAFFGTLADRLQLDRQRLLFTPGNHDVSWPATKRAMLDQEEWGFDEAELRRRMASAKLRPYARFLSEVTGLRPEEHGVELSGGARLYNFPDLRLSLAALNTCKRESHRPSDHGGYLGESQLHPVRQAWRLNPQRSWLKLLALHHPPRREPSPELAAWAARLSPGGALTPELVAQYKADATGLSGVESLRALAADSEAQLLLHGHGEALDLWPWAGERAGQTLALGAGSSPEHPDQAPADLPSFAQLLHVDVERRELRRRTLRVRSEADGRLKVERPPPESPRLSLCLPEGFARAPTAEADPDLAAFVDAYRRRLHSAYARWDLGSSALPHPSLGGRPVEARLDDMYQPLRFRVGFDLRSPDGGEPIQPRDVLGRSRALVVRGRAGAGKSSWMRWTFRQLLNDRQALPLMIELRRLARAWGPDRQGEARSLDHFLDEHIVEHMGGRWRGWLTRVLEQPDGPVPVLLMDGWDELGELGEELRGKLLGLQGAYPRLQVVVSSRPYGRGRPGEPEGFEVLDVQPLNRQEVEALSLRFHDQLHGADARARDESQQRFLSALERSREVQQLSRTPLLLTMMLLIARSRALPDNRHKLYQACIESLLTALPDRRQEEGAQLLREQWRPEEPDERLRVVSALAYALQDSAFHGELRAPVIRSWEEMLRLLPSDWPRQQRNGLLAWLSGPAGILVKRVDGTLAFTHLSIQEYLAAWHLNATIEGGEARRALVLERVHDEDWWETLRLWASLVGATNPRRLVPVLRALAEGDDKARGLAGCMYADGLGEENLYVPWAKLWASGMAEAWPRAGALCAQAWGSSRQDGRRRLLLRELERCALVGSWSQWLRLREWSADALLCETLPEPEGQLARAVIDAISGKVSPLPCLAAGRVLQGGSPLWPAEDRLGLLCAWPNRRRRLGWRLQVLATFGAGADSLRDLAPELLDDPPLDEDILTWVELWQRGWRAHLDRYFFREFDEHWLTEAADKWARDLACDLSTGLPGRDARRWAEAWSGSMPERLARLHGVTRAPSQAWELGKMISFCVSEDELQRRVAALGEEDRVAGLLGAAMRVRLELKPPDTLRSYLQARPARGEPLWTALARHLAGQARPADTELLLARVSEPDDSPLGQGLRFIARGDVMIEGGLVLTLEELGVELPLLED
ncbi:MAG: NACHT domain-containing protein [Alphaproteobacteria bacterium]|nr:NACHT domain-containing protein [Alphaproteobacteria bacterium]